MPKNILFLVPYPIHESPSQRFRFEQYFKILEESGYHFRVQSFLTTHNWQLFFKPNHTIAKLRALLAGFLKRIAVLFSAPAYDFIFIHREAAPIGPPVIEWLLANFLRKKIIYDFDDAIWLTDKINESTLVKIIKHRSKVKSICRWAYRVSCGNDYLCTYAAQFNAHVVYNPTTIDTVHWHNPELFTVKKNNDILTIGWTGSHSTLKYLQEVEPVLKKIESLYPHVQILIIADRPPTLLIASLKFVPWNVETEIEDLMQIDIGIMPLPDDKWANGKCGFKALQYMALNIPSVISPVGVNTKIIDHSVNGFLASTSEEWFDCIQKLINNNTLRSQMGMLSRKKVIEHYSVTSNAATFLSLFT